MKWKMSNVEYTFDGTIEGFLSVVFDAYSSSIIPARIDCESEYSPSLFGEVHFSPTVEEHYIRVHKSFVKNFGKEEFDRIKISSLSEDKDRYIKIFRYIKKCFQYGKSAMYDIASEETSEFENLWKSVYNERHRILQFLRFSELDNGVFYAKINPNANVIPIVMDHFAKRFNIQPFIIYDEIHKVAGFYDMKDWYLSTQSDLISALSSSQNNQDIFTTEEDDFTRLWKCFYDTIANKERYNPKLRMQFMPKRLWKNICELNSPQIIETNSLLNKKN